MILLGQGAIAGGCWLLSRTLGWELAVGVALILEGAIGALYGMLDVAHEPEPWHGGMAGDIDGDR
jgi:hypothetical protein